MKVYIDVCCLHRPFDDQGQERIRIESEAVKVLFDLRAKGRITWVSSEAVEDEILRNPDVERRLIVWSLLRSADERLVANEQAQKLAEHWVDQGVRAMDATHLALAETGGCDILVTTDDSFVRRARALKPPTRVRIDNPAKWIVEFLES